MISHSPTAHELSILNGKILVAAATPRERQRLSTYLSTMERLIEGSETLQDQLSTLQQSLEVVKGGDVLAIIQKLDAANRNYEDLEKENEQLQQAHHVMREALNDVKAAASGENQVADDDTDGMEWIAERAKDALSSTPPSDLVAKSDVMPIVEKLQRLSHICSCGAGSSKPTTKHAGHCACCLALDALALATHLGLVKEDKPL